MSRVSENSSINSINYAVGKTKGRLEDLQMKGSTLKRIAKPSDDPIGNTELLAIRSQSIDAEQYMRNLNYAQTQLSYTENVLEEMTDILSKAKELAVGQASTLYGPEIRQGVSKEIHQLRQQILSIANKRIGNRYLFSGQKVLTRPFDQNGQYQGDKNKINIEINKDVYVPININGDELFFTKGLQKKPAQKEDLDLKLDVDLNGDTSMVRKPASDQPEEVTVSVFDEMRALENALLTDNPQIVQSLLERLDSSLEKNKTCECCT
jgi:flagellar hook-associated protein 3 FlgL